MYYFCYKWLGDDVTCNVTRMGVLCVSDFLTRKQTIVTVLRIYPIISKRVWKHGLALYHLQRDIHSKLFNKMFGYWT